MNSLPSVISGAHVGWISWLRLGSLLVRLVLGGIFIYAGMLSVVSPQDFADSIAAYRILPAYAINLLALGLPFFEIACGLLVLSGYYLRLGLLGITAMLFVFMMAIVLALIRGLKIECGCFGGGAWFESNLWVALFRDALLLGVAMLLYRRCRTD